MSSGLSDKENAPAVTEPLGGAAALGAQVQPTAKPVQIWAFFGGVILAFQLYVWIRWITGPIFRAGARRGERSADADEGGPHDVDGRDHASASRSASTTSSSGPGGGSGESRLDGMLLVACGLMFFQDPLLNYFNTWSTYNTWMWNRGSWVQDIPGWQSYGQAGPHDGRTAADERAGLLVRSSAVHDARMLGHAQSQVALAEHQQPSSDRRCRPLGVLLRLRHGGLLPDADGALHLPRRNQVAVGQRRHLLPVARSTKG